MSGGEVQFAGRGGRGHQSAGLQLNPNEKELMEVKQRINANFEEIRHSVGSVQLKYIEIVQKDLARGHELLHALIVTECRNKVNMYKRQLDRLDKALEAVLGANNTGESSPEDGIILRIPEAVYCAIFSNDETMIASVCGDGVVRINETATGRLIHECVGHGPDLLIRVDRSPDGTRIISGGKDNTARIWDIKTGECLMVLSGHSEAVLGAAFVDDLTAFTCSHDGTIRVFDLKSGKCKMILQPSGKPLLVGAALPGRRRIAVGDSDGMIFVIDSRKGTILQAIHGHRSAIWGMDFSPNGKMLCSCGEDSIVRVWDIETGSLIRSFGEEGLCSNFCHFSNNSKMVAAGNMDRTFRIWNLETGSLMRTITGHAGWAFGCVFSADDRLLLTSAEDGTVRLWRVDTGEPVTPDMLEKGSGCSPSLEEESNCENNQQMPEADDANINLCPEHNRPLGFYCVEERKFLCDECVSVHDKQHHVADGLGMSKMAEHALQSVITSFLKSVSGTDEMLDADMNILMESRIAARRKVEMTMDTLLEAVLTRRKQLLKQIDVAFDQAMISIYSQHNARERDFLARMRSFDSEITTGMLCDTYMNADTRFTEPLPPLMIQPLQVFYFGNTQTQSIAANISRMGNVVINTQSSVPVRKPEAQIGSMAERPTMSLSSSEPSMGDFPTLSLSGSIQSNQDVGQGSSPVSGSSSESLKNTYSPPQES